MPDRLRRVFITVADFSGDLHAAEFIRALRSLDPDIAIDGIGGPRMAEAGANIIYESVGRAAMGLRGVYRAFEVMRLIRRTRRRYQQPDTKPDLHVCIDSSAMNLPFARMAKECGVPALYYVSPQVWASRERRIKKIRAYVDRVACILPFEQEYYRRHGVNATFVGHPLFDEIPGATERAEAVNQLAPRFPEAPPVIGIIPGSRRAEVRANLPHLLAVAHRIRSKFFGATFLVPTTDVVHESVVNTISTTPGCRESDFTVRRDAFDELIPRCDLCLCKSGTSTLHVAAYGVPMIVVYRISRLAWHAVLRWVVKTKKIALVNILAGNTDLVPEFVPWYGSNDAVAETAMDLLEHPDKLADQRRKLNELVSTLNRPGASMNAARMAMEMIAASGAALAHA
jgi:lipid-A-disaccharide synthase